MEDNFEQRMALKSDEDLMLYIDNAERYTQEAVHAVIAELQKRGKHFEAEEIAAIDARVQKQQEEYVMMERKEMDSMRDINVVDDKDAIELYTPRAIYLFSFLLTPITGAILLAKNVQDRKIKRLIIISGILYVAVCVTIINVLPHLIQRNFPILPILLNGLGGYVLEQIFWDKYIGSKTKYRARPIWVPLIICILILVIIVSLNIWFSSQFN